MYVPGPHRADIVRARALVDEVGSGWLVTNGPSNPETPGGPVDPPKATLLPLLWRGDVVTMHMAKANPQWRSIGGGTPGLVIVTGPEAYVSPSWYPSKQEHSRVLPTWNYLAVHLSGALHVHHEPDWLRDAVSDLTDRHEADRHDRWHVTDAPDDFVSARLKGIVGIEMRVSSIEAKAKLSRDKSDADRDGVIEGLRAESTAPGASAIADAMAALYTDPH